MCKNTDVQKHWAPRELFSCKKETFLTGSSLEDKAKIRKTNLIYYYFLISCSHDSPRESQERILVKLRKLIVSHICFISKYVSPDR